MISDEQRDLISAGVDGQLNESEQRQLDRVIAESDDARLLFLKLSATNETLSRIQSVTPPNEIKRQVMSHIKEHPRSHASRESVSSSSSVFAELVSRVIGPFRNSGRILVFAGGVAVGIAVFALLDLNTKMISSGSSDNLAGSMIHEHGASGVGSGPNETLSLEGAQGTIGIVSENSEISLAVAIDSKSEYEIEVTFDGKPLNLNGWYCQNPEVISLNSDSEITRFSGAGIANFVARFEVHGAPPSEALVRVIVVGETQEFRFALDSQD